MSKSQLRVVGSPEKVGADGLLEPEVINPVPLVLAGAALALAVATGVGAWLLNRLPASVFHKREDGNVEYWIY